MFLANSPKLLPRTEHIGVKYHLFREHINRGDIEVVWIPTEKRKANILTKGLGSTNFVENRKEMMS